MSVSTIFICLSTWMSACFPVPTCRVVPSHLLLKLDGAFQIRRTLFCVHLSGSEKLIKLPLGIFSRKLRLKQCKWQQIRPRISTVHAAITLTAHTHLHAQMQRHVLNIYSFSVSVSVSSLRSCNQTVERVKTKKEVTKLLHLYLRNSYIIVY